MMFRPALETFPAFYRGYVAHLDGKSLFEALNDSADRFEQVSLGIDENLSAFRYAPDKWSIKSVIQHVIDAERIFSYRSLVFARQDKLKLPGFDEVMYAENSGADLRKWDELIQEFRILRQSTLLLFSSFDSKALAQVGYANQVEISVLCLGFIISGHLDHHISILYSRYLKNE